MNILAEGGNVFKDIHSDPIKKEDIKPTLKEFFKEWTRIFPGSKPHLEKAITLGSVGKKSISGDIDLGIDEGSLKSLEDWGVDPNEVKQYFEKFKAKARTATKEQLIRRATLTCIAERIQAESDLINVDTKGTGNGVIFTQFPQFTESGEQNGKFVQCDCMFGNLPWLKFSYYSDAYPEGSNIKGLHRTQLVLTLFANKGYVFSHGTGVKNKETGEMVANTPEQAIDLLNKLYGFDLDQSILNSYIKLQDYLKEHLDKDELDKIYARYLKILDSTRCDIPNDDLQGYWLDNQERLGLTGNFLPASSKLYPFRDLD